jgi:hypothetical protein
VRAVRLSFVISVQCDRSITRRPHPEERPQAKHPLRRLGRVPKNERGFPYGSRRRKGAS